MSHKHKIVLFAILFIGLFVRLVGVNWDQGWHLHPDERFLTMVGTSLTIPNTITAYLDQHVSSFNPTNKGNSFFVYGTFPLLLNKLIAEFFYNDTYELFNLQGRALSALADFFVILIIFKLVRLVEKKLKLHWSIAYLSAFFYAIAVLPIQLSHFFTVDTFLNVFCWASLYFAVKSIYSCNAKRTAQNVIRYTLYELAHICLSGLFLGLALACKVSAIYFAPLVGVFVLIGLLTVIPAEAGIQTRMTVLLRASIGMTGFIVSCYLALRLGSPYYFQTGNLLNPQLSTVFLSSIKTLQSYENPSMLFPPGIQWLSKSFWFPIKNILFFGVGPVYFLLSLFGIFLLFKKKNVILYATFVWVILFVVYQSLQFAKTMRYLIFIYPLLAISAAVGLQKALYKISTFSNVLRYTLYVFGGILIVVWPLAFLSIYTVNQSRVTASHWMYDNLPSRSTILTEYWDDPLPLMTQDPTTRNYVGREVHIFDPDSKVKWETIDRQLREADYYIMSSNRGWGSIGDVPSVYPQTSAFYKQMMAGTRGYQLIKSFTSYPSLRYLGIPLDLPDQWAEEAFTVYDHPEVLLFKKK